MTATLPEWFAAHGFQRVGDHYEGWLSAKAAQELAAVAPPAEQPDASSTVMLKIADGRLVSGELARAAAAAGDERHCILTLATE